MKKQKSLDPEYEDYYDDVKPLNEEAAPLGDVEEAKVTYDVPTKAEPEGCPVGYFENQYGQCITPGIKKLDKQIKEFEDKADEIKRLWRDMNTLATTAGRYPLEGKNERVSVLGRLFENNINDLKEIKKYLFW